MALTSTAKLHFEQRVPKIHIYFFIIVYSVLIFVALFEASAKDFVKGGPGDCSVPFLQWDDGRVVQGCAPGTEGIDPSGFQKPVLEVDNNGTSRPEECDLYKSSCESLSQFGKLLKTAVIGEDSRRPADFSRADDKLLNGVGLIYNNKENGCLDDDDVVQYNVRKCAGTGHLLVNRDTFTSNLHIFFTPSGKARNGKPNDPFSGYSFYIYEDGHLVEYIIDEREDKYCIPLNFNEVGTPYARDKDIFVGKLTKKVSSKILPLKFNQHLLDSKASLENGNKFKTIAFQHDKKKINGNDFPYVNDEECSDKGKLLNTDISVKQDEEPYIKYIRKHDCDTNGLASGSSVISIINGEPFFMGLHFRSSTYRKSGTFDEKTHYNEYITGIEIANFVNRCLNYLH